MSGLARVHRLARVEGLLLVSPRVTWGSNQAVLGPAVTLTWSLKLAGVAAAVAQI